MEHREGNWAYDMYEECLDSLGIKKVGVRAI